jgi:hypothetical protein
MFSPGNPLVPFDRQQLRVWDYPFLTNTIYTPRSTEAISFAELRALAQAHDLTRIAIETRKDQIESLEWQIKPIDAKQVMAGVEDRIAAVTQFWKRPDGYTPFPTWLREAIEDVLITDAPAFEVRTNRVGDIIGLDLIDGATIKVLLDDTGRRPRPPAPAYEQIIHGRPWVLLQDGTRAETDEGEVVDQFNDGELIYCPRNPRSHKLYGFSPVEQIVSTINIGLRRQAKQLEHFTSGNIPPGMINAPDGWTPSQIAEIQMCRTR